MVKALILFHGVSFVVVSSSLFIKRALPTRQQAGGWFDKVPEHTGGSYT